MRLHWPDWLTRVVRRRLGWSLAAALGLPWLLGEWAKTTLQPGLSDSAERSAMRVDFMVAGAMLFGLSMVVVLACGFWIVAVMRGPRRDGDPFPPDEPRVPKGRT